MRNRIDQILFNARPAERFGIQSIGHKGRGAQTRFQTAHQPGQCRAALSAGDTQPFGIRAAVFKQHVKPARKVVNHPTGEMVAGKQQQIAQMRLFILHRFSNPRTAQRRIIKFKTLALSAEVDNEHRHSAPRQHLPQALHIRVRLPLRPRSGDAQNARVGARPAFR